MKSLKFTKNFSIVFLRLIVGALIGLLLSSFLARNLGPAGNGTYAIAILCPMMAVSFGGLGIGAATVYLISNGNFSLSEIVCKNILIGVVASIAIITLGLILLFLFGRVWFASAPLSVMVLALLMTLFLMLFSNLATIFQGLQDFRLHGFFTLLPQSTTLIILLFSLNLFSDKVMVAVSIWGVGYCIALGVMLYNLRKYLNGFWPNVRKRSGYLSQLLNYGLKTHIGNLVTMLNYRLDVYLIGAMIGPQGVGIYAVTVPITEATWLISNAASTIIFPMVAADQSNGSGSIKNTTPIVCRWVFFVTLLSAFIIGGLREHIVDLFFGVAYELSANILLWLLPGVVMWAGARVLCNDIAGRGRPEINLIISFFTLMLNIICNIVFLPLFGVAGAAISSSISYTFFSISVLIIYSRLTKLKIREFFIPSWHDWVLLCRVIESPLLRNIIGDEKK